MFSGQYEFGAYRLEAQSGMLFREGDQERRAALHVPARRGVPQIVPAEVLFVCRLLRCARRARAGSMPRIQGI